MQIVFVFAFLTFLFIGVVSFFVWLAFDKERSFLYWAVAAGLPAVGWGLLFFSGPLQSPFGIGLAESMIFAGHICGYLALVQFSYGEVRRSQHVFWVCAGLAFFLVDAVSRTWLFRQWDGVLALLHGTLDFMMILVIFRERRPENRGVVYSTCAIKSLLVMATYLKGIQTFLHASSDAAITVPDEVNAAVVLSTTLALLVGTVALSLLAFTRTARSMQELASLDPLTQALNRRAWDAALIRETARAGRTKDPFCVVMLDLDLFKTINDRYGHAAGDATLKSVVDLIGSILRDFDIVCRYGGEEFLILLANTRLNVATGIAERIRQLVEQTPVNFGDTRFQITCSAGVAEFNPLQNSVQDVVALADQAMYQAKTRGRNRVVVAGQASD